MSSPSEAAAPTSAEALVARIEAEEDFDLANHPGFEEFWVAMPRWPFVSTDVPVLVYAVHRYKWAAARKLDAAGAPGRLELVFLTLAIAAGEACAWMFPRVKDFARPQVDSFELALANALERKELALADALLSHGLPINQLNSFGLTALHVAAIGPTASPEIIAFLLQRGADPAIQGEAPMSLTALDWAVSDHTGSQPCDFRALLAVWPDSDVVREHRRLAGCDARPDARLGVRNRMCLLEVLALAGCRHPRLGLASRLPPGFRRFGAPDLLFRVLALLMGS